MKWKHHLVAVPGLVTAVLPKFACPVCAAAAIGTLSSFGLGYLLTVKYLLPITSVLLALALFGLGFRASRRRGYMPLGIGILAAAAILLGKFKWDSTSVVYGGVALLVVVSMWNAWPLRIDTTLLPCDRCLTSAKD